MRRDTFEKTAPAAASGFILTTRHGVVDMVRRTAIMGVVNVTPDSFSDGGRFFDAESAAAHGERLAAEGADILDIGGESTRPGAKSISAAEEIRRVLPVIERLRAKTAIPISIDTVKGEVARAALDAGADIVNDVSALRGDAAMAALVARERVPVVLMHMQGTPQTMQQNPAYENVVEEVAEFLKRKAEEASAAGVAADNIVIDPGIGFGKNLDHNLALLRRLSALTALGYPLLVGASRKAFIGRILDLGPDERLEGSIAAAVAAALGGANIVRVHDVKEAARALRVADALRFGARESRETRHA
ncbi:MAG TPA: dihydropteroate synthase [Candidatus Binatia bacterium]|jgi:dihydropteroate synthase